MDLDASPPPATPADAVPRFDPARTRVVGLVGLGMNAAAAVLALVAAVQTSAAGVLTPVQLFLVGVGAVAAGASVSMRPDLWWAWALGAATAALGSVGLPASWDSFPALFRTMTGVALVGTVVCLSSTGWRVAILSGCVTFHFLGIFSATTAPPPQPWLIEQAWTRVYYPYLNFIYLRNAYHFYSPEPGPASLLVFHLKTETEAVDPETGQKVKKYQTRWVAMPRRPADLRDPLGLAYFRRLSLTEHIARGSAGLLGTGDFFEKTDVYERRKRKADPLFTNRDTVIPFHPVDSISSAQYRLPNAEIIRYILPSYASHVILEQTPDAAAAGRTTVKIYRLEHQATSVERFRAGDDPYHPATYRPYFLGEFNARGALLNPQDELLYWMVPVIPYMPAPGDENKNTYLDFMSVHATGMTRDAVRADVKGDKAFDWSQLR